MFLSVTKISLSNKVKCDLLSNNIFFISFSDENCWQEHGYPAQMDFAVNIISDYWPQDSGIVTGKNGDPVFDLISAAALLYTVLQL